MSNCDMKYIICSVLCRIFSFFCLSLQGISWADRPRISPSQSDAAISTTYDDCITAPTGRLLHKPTFWAEIFFCNLINPWSRFDLYLLYAQVGLPSNGQVQGFGLMTSQPYPGMMPSMGQPHAAFPPQNDTFNQLMAGHQHQVKWFCKLFINP